MSEGQRPYHDAKGYYMGSVDNASGCQHPPDKIRMTGGCRRGCCDDYTCQECGSTFRVEVPD